MGANITRTVSDEITDALAELRDAEAELARWRQHLERALQTPDAAGVIHQAANSAGRVEASITAAAQRTRAARQVTVVS